MLKILSICSGRIPQIGTAAIKLTFQDGTDELIMLQNQALGEQMLEMMKNASNTKAPEMFSGEIEFGDCTFSKTLV